MTPDMDDPLLGVRDNQAGDDDGDPIAAMREHEKRETRKFLQLVLAASPYTKYIGLQPRLKLDEFKDLRGLAMVDAFFNLSTKEIQVRLGVDEAVVKRLRGHPHYEAIQAGLVEAATAQAATTIDALAKGMEGSIAREMMAVALLGNSPREQQAALKEVADRLNPKPGREAAPRGIIFPPELIAIIGAGMRMMPAGSDTIEIKASKVNVPELEESNERD